MNGWELSPDELLEAAAPRGELFTIYQRDQCRRVADKATEKAYEQGRRDLAKSILIRSGGWPSWVEAELKRVFKEKGLL